MSRDFEPCLQNDAMLPHLTDFDVCLQINSKLCCNNLKGQSHKNQRGLPMLIFPRRQQCYHLFEGETRANRAITAQSWDYLVYLPDLAVHKDRLPQKRRRHNQL